MLDSLFRGVFDSDITIVIGVTDFLLCLGCALLLGLAMAFAYMFRTRYTKSFVVTLALLPLIVLFVLFNVVGLDINICIIISTALSVILFKDQLHGSSLRNLLSTGASESIHMSMTVAAICGFAGVVTETEAFTQMLNAIISIDISPMLICAIVVAVMCMLTGGSSTGQLISLPLIAPKLTELGLSVGAIHRIGCFAATTLDSLPYSGAILLLPLGRMKLRGVCPPP